MAEEVMSVSAELKLPSVEQFPDSYLTQWLRKTEFERNRARRRFLASPNWIEFFDRLVVGYDAKIELPDTRERDSQMFDKVVVAAETNQPIEKSFEMRHEHKDDPLQQNPFAADQTLHGTTSTGISSSTQDISTTRDTKSSRNQTSDFEGSELTGRGRSYSLAQAAVFGVVSGLVVLILWFIFSFFIRLF